MDVLDFVYELIRYEVVNHPVRSFIDVVLIVLFVYMLFQKSYRIPKHPEKLTEEVSCHMVLPYLFDYVSLSFSERAMEERERVGMCLGKKYDWNRHYLLILRSISSRIGNEYAGNGHAD